MKGWVYIISNPALSGLVKIGHSMKDPDLRAQELDNTGVPHRYEVEYEVLINDPRDAEQRLHRILSSRREGKEWFRATPAEVIKMIKETFGHSIINEWYKKAQPESSTTVESDVKPADIADLEYDKTKEPWLDSLKQQLSSQLPDLGRQESQLSHNQKLLLAGSGVWSTTTSELLMEAGYGVTQVPTCRHLLPSLEKNEFDVVLLTNDDPSKGEGTPEIVEEIRKRYPLIGIIVVSGWMDLKIAIDLKKRGVDDAVRVPFEMTNLIEVIQKVIEKQPSTRN